MSASISSRPVRVGLTPTLRMVRPRSRRQAAGNDEEGRRGKIARHRDARTRPGAAPPARLTQAAVALHRHAEAPQHALGVIARRRRLGDAAGALARKARPAAARISPVRWRSASRSRCRAAAHRRGSVPAGARRGYRCARPSTRSGCATRSIGRRMSEASPTSVLSKALPGQQSHRQAHRRARIAHVQRSRRRAQADEPDTVPRALGFAAGRSIATPSELQRGQGRQAILAGEESVICGCCPRQCRRASARDARWICRPAHAAIAVDHA